MANGLSTLLRFSAVAFGASMLAIACGSDPSGENTPPTGDDGGAESSFVTGDSGGSGSCTPKTCKEMGVECGPSGDGCGGVIQDCGKCADGLRCGDGTNSKCVSPNIDGGACTPKTCADLGIECGPAGDGCGGIIQCGTCGANQQCGSDTEPSKCVNNGPVGPDGGACVPKTCTDLFNASGVDCGDQSDGCGNIIQCGTCTAPASCGGGGVPSKCGGGGLDGGTCVPKTCANFPGVNCGQQPDGCGGVTQSCGTCSGGQVCGGGGVPSKCGGSVVGADGGTCQPTTCAAAGKNCGTIADGCGAVLTCGSLGGACPAGQVCGANGTPNVCAVPPCTPITVCPASMNCGSIANGCGGTVSCGGACTAPAICGGGGVANKCGGGVPVNPDGGTCTPRTCAQAGANCGQVANGCGGLTAVCGTCTGGNICGGGGTPSVCGGAVTCTPKTCAQLNANCGQVADGCGGLTPNCGTCGAGSTCGVPTPNVCSGTVVTCTNLCLQQQTCTPSTKTKLKGVVYAPNGFTPIYDAFVYIPNSPNGTVDTIPTGATCDTCAPATGDPLVSTRSLADGSFTIDNVPTGNNIPVIIQVGKWRRKATVNITNACADNTITCDPTTVAGRTACPTRLPRWEGEGGEVANHLPKMLVTTGGADTLGCLLRKVGVDDGEFTKENVNSPLPAPRVVAPGRVNVFNGSGGSTRFVNGFNGFTTNATRIFTTFPTFVASAANLQGYDALLLTCEGLAGDNQTDYSANRANMQTYADNGGKIFASHWHHAWLEYGSTAWQALATIDHQADLQNPITADITLGNAKGAALNAYLQALGSPSANGQISIISPQHTITATSANTTQLISIANPIDENGDPTNNSVQYFTFNTPVPTASVPNPTQCGRMVVTDLHVSGNAVANPAPGNDDVDANFPSGCISSMTNLTDQEKALIYMLFDLTSCVQPPTCTPKTCAQLGVACGQASNGCSGTQNCGNCPNGQTCGGGGVPSQCGGPTCTKRTCAQQNAGCGTQVPDGCGGTLNCGTCPAGQTCGGGGVANQCGAPSCTKLTCAGLGITCGPAGDGCGGTLQCGTCPTGQTCGGGGVPGKCGAPPCNPLLACPPGLNCGQYPNGCGGTLDCGTCPNGQTCGGSGTPNVCGIGSCTAQTCGGVGAACGPISDGCGNITQCGNCPPGEICQNNQCSIPSCTKTTCAAAGLTCGPLGDGCGGLLDCGTCPPNQTCGGGGVPGQCGGPTCTPKTCASLGATCGQVADGCGALTADCGTCATNQSCSNGTCVNTCTPRTCTDAGAKCGQVADGCGGLTPDCGPCPPGQTCGGGGVPNQCGGGIR